MSTITGRSDPPLSWLLSQIACVCVHEYADELWVACPQPPAPMRGWHICHSRWLSPYPIPPHRQYLQALESAVFLLLGQRGSLATLIAARWAWCRRGAGVVQWPRCEACTSLTLWGCLVIGKKWHSPAPASVSPLPDENCVFLQGVLLDQTRQALVYLLIAPIL